MEVGTTCAACTWDRRCTHVVGQMGTNVCPSGGSRISGVAACHAAATRIGAVYKGYPPGYYALYPAGCYLYAGTVSGWHGVWLNTGNPQHTRANAQAAPVCTTQTW